MTGSPWAYHAHSGGLAVVVAAIGAYVVVSRRYPPTPRQRWQFAGLCGALALALTWPVADMAAHWTLTGLLVQRLILTLAAAPLLVLCLPTPFWGRVTRRPAVDALVDALTRPPVAIAVFTVVVVGTLTVPAVRAEAASQIARAVFDTMLLGAGLVLWVPVLGRIPGARRLSPVGRAAYLVVQSVLPNFPAVIFIFARHPLYPAFVHAHLAIGLRPLNDQQLAGVVAKVGTLPVLWTAAYISLARAQRAEELGQDTETLTWVEVERQLERAARRAPRDGEAAAPG